MKNPTRRKICNRFEKSYKEDGFCWQDFNIALDGAIEIGKAQAIAEVEKIIKEWDVEPCCHGIPQDKLLQNLKTLKEKQ